jgi:hypothetical protein
MSKRIWKLTGEVAKKAACREILAAQEGMVVTLAEPTRNLDQSAKFYAICGDIAKQKPFAGQMRKPEQWKVLLVSGHAIATKQGSEMVPGLEGEWCNLRESTAQMSIKRMASLIEYALAYCAQNEIRLSAYEHS